MIERILEQIKNNLNGSSLFLKGYDHDYTLSMKEFILVFLTDLNCTYNTHSTDEAINSRDFTEDQENKCYCRGKRYRSLGDIYAVVKHYYPEATLEEVVRVLYARSHGNLAVSSYYCSDINKQVYYAVLVRNQVRHVWRNPCEFGFYEKDYLALCTN